ncbi:hypothetical protein Tco_0901243 [Tanacetum coccineum]
MNSYRALNKVALSTSQFHELKGKVDKHRSFTVNLKHDGVFSPYPFSYINGDEKQLTDINFEGISYADLRELVRKIFKGWGIDYESGDSSDAYSSSDEEVIDHVDFFMRDKRMW